MHLPEPPPSLLESSTPPPAEQTEAALKKKRPILPEERAFDTAFYGGMGVGGAAALSVVSADYVKYGGGKAKCEHLARRFAGFLNRSMGISHGRANTVATSFVMVTALMSGGLVLLYPLKKAEDNKPELVRKLYNWRHQKPGMTLSDEQKAKDEYALQRLEQQPKQTWGSILGGRVVGTLGVYAAMAAAGKPAEKFSEDVAESAARSLSASPSQSLQALGNSEKFRRLADVSTLELIQSAICSGALYLYTHLIRPPKHTDGEAAMEDLQEENNITFQPSNTNSALPAAARPALPREGAISFAKRVNPLAETAGHGNRRLQEKVAESDNHARGV